jgi:chromosomal replication initiator protein
VTGPLATRDGPLIDGVLQLEFPRGPLAAALGGLAPTLVIGPENDLLAPPLERLLAVSAYTDGQAGLAGEAGADSEAGSGEVALFAEQFNPLALVGPSGSGKSLVAQGVARAWSERFGAAAVAYYTAVDFGRERQAAEADERIAAWRDQVRGVRMLVVDDVDRLRPRATIQCELGDTIDAIIAGGGVVVVTALREPYLCKQLDARLRDRLVAGLTARIERPALVTRRALLAHSAAARGLALSDVELDHLAEAECNTPAQLVGRLNEHATQQMSSSAPLSSTERGGGRGECSGYPVQPSPPGRGGRKNSWESHSQLKHVLAVAARYFGVTQAAITSKSRRTSLVEARNVIVHFARRKTDLSYAEIGRVLGGRDHTTIMHADRRLAERLSTDAALAQSVVELERLLD